MKKNIVQILNLDTNIHLDMNKFLSAFLHFFFFLNNNKRRFCFKENIVLFSKELKSYPASNIFFFASKVANSALVSYYFCCSWGLFTRSKSL